MSMTAVEKIFASHAGREEVKANEIVTARVDRILLHDMTGPMTISQLGAMGVKKIADPERVLLFGDHIFPAKDVPSAANLLSLRSFAKENGIVHYYEMGDSGIEHTFLPEIGLVLPGNIVIGADSHTCTCGACGALGIGMGSTDIAAAIALGESWFVVPETMRFEFQGKFQAYVTGKDLILHILKKITVDGATYRCMEFSGGGIHALDLDGRIGLCNMAVEAGAKTCIIPADEITLKWAHEVTDTPINKVVSDRNASFLATYTYDLSAIPPLVARPHSPDNVVPVEEVHGVGVDQVYIGGCANGTISDLRQAARVFKDHKVARGVRCIIVPATQRIYRLAVQEGLCDIFLRAGITICPPTCGACAGLHMGVLAAGETALSTTNRNFRGRWGTRALMFIWQTPMSQQLPQLLVKLCHPRR